MTFHAVNQHCLSSISKLTETREVIASDDIIDELGFKLWAKGNQVSHDLTEKLLRRKLAKPLETSLTVEGALTMTDIVKACHQHLEKNPQLGRIAGSEALKLLNEFKTFQLPEPMRLLLTSAQHSEIATFRHTISTLLVSAGIATMLNTSERETKILLLATLFHDLGEIYIDPSYLKKTHRLVPQEWKHITSHPRIGQMLLEEFTKLPASIGQCIAHHHERHDGSGYPKRIDGNEHHPLANWLAIADTVAPILTDGDCGAPLRASLALRVVPEEFDSAAVAAVTRALHKGEKCLNATDRISCAKTATAPTTWQTLADTIAHAKSLVATTELDFVRKTAESALSLLITLNKSLRATGVTELGALTDNDEDDGELIIEICQIEKELIWRMRNLARTIHLRADQHTEKNCLTSLAPLISMLDIMEGPSNAEV